MKIISKWTAVNIQRKPITFKGTLELSYEIYGQMHCPDIVILPDDIAEGLDLLENFLCERW